MLTFALEEVWPQAEVFTDEERDFSPAFDGVDEVIPAVEEAREAEAERLREELLRSKVRMLRSLKGSALEAAGLAWAEEISGGPPCWWLHAAGFDGDPAVLEWLSSLPPLEVAELILQHQNFKYLRVEDVLRVLDEVEGISPDPDPRGFPTAAACAAYWAPREAWREAKDDPRWRPILKWIGWADRGLGHALFGGDAPPFLLSEDFSRPEFPAPKAKAPRAGNRRRSGKKKAGRRRFSAKILLVYNAKEASWQGCSTIEFERNVKKEAAKILLRVLHGKKVEPAFDETSWVAFRVLRKARFLSRKEKERLLRLWFPGEMLGLLRALSREEWKSARKLSEETGLSVARIHSLVKELRRRGAPVESSGRGYRLRESSPGLREKTAEAPIFSLPFRDRERLERFVR